MKKITTTVYTYDDKDRKNGEVVTEETDFENGIVGVCDGDCENCEDPMLCEDTIELSPVLESTVEFDLLDTISKAFAMIALGFSAATAIKLWKKVR